MPCEKSNMLENFQNLEIASELFTRHEQSPWEHAVCSLWEMFYNHVLCTNQICLCLLGMSDQA